MSTPSKPDEDPERKAQDATDDTNDAETSDPEQGDSGSAEANTEAEAEAGPDAGSDVSADAAGDPAADAPDDAKDDAEDEADEGKDEDRGAADAALTGALAAAPLIRDGAVPAADPPHESPAADASADHHSDEEHEQQRSLAARVLTWLVLLLVGGGIALWGAPRIAPHLPAALDPVKAYLLPGERLSEQRIAAVEADLGARIDGIAPGIGAEEATALAETAASDAVAAAMARADALEERLTALSDQVAAVDGASVESRLAQVETRLDGVAAEIAALSEAGQEGLSPEQLEQLGTFSASVEGLRAEVASIADLQGQVAQRIDDVEAAVDRRLNEAEVEVAAAKEETAVVRSTADAQAALATIEAALISGDPYAPALATLDANTAAEVPEALAASAEAGVATLPALRDGFADAAHAAIRASIKAERTGNVGGRLAAFIEAQVASRSLEPKEGTTTDAILSRAEDALRRDNLAAAVDELDGLSEVAQSAMGTWLTGARARLGALAAFNTVSAAMTAQN